MACSGYSFVRPVRDRESAGAVRIPLVSERLPSEDVCRRPREGLDLDHRDPTRKGQATRVQFQMKIRLVDDVEFHSVVANINARVIVNAEIVGDADGAMLGPDKSGLA